MTGEGRTVGTGVGVVVVECLTDGELTMLWQQFHAEINSGSWSLWWWLGAEEVATDEQDRLDVSRQVVGILAKSPVDLGEDDVALMQRVVARARALRGELPEQR